MLTPEKIRGLSENVLPDVQKAAAAARERNEVVTMSMRPDFADELVEYVRMLEERNRRLGVLLQAAMGAIRTERKRANVGS